MIDKEDLMNHKNLWAYVRLVNRTIAGWKADKIHYYHKEQKAGKRFNSLFSDLKNILIDEIKNEPQLSFSLSSANDHINTVDLEMLSNNGDQMGKVFKYQGKIYRGIYQERVQEFESIWNKGIFHVLWKHRLIPKIMLTRYVTDEFPVVIEIQKVNIVDNNNWTFTMIRDACCLVSLLTDVLNEFDCTLLDGHLNNVTFDHGRPVFVDIGSIICYRQTAVKEELAFCGLYRLLFGYLGNVMLYRMPVFSVSLGTAFVEPRFYNQMTRDYRYCLRKFLQYQLMHYGPKRYFTAFKMFCLYEFNVDDIENIFTAYIDKTKEDICINLYVQSAVLEKLSDCFAEKTVLDIGGGAKFLEKILDKQTTISKIYYLDYDEKRLDQVYLNNYKYNIDSQYSLSNYIYLQKEQIEQRFAVDTVVAWFPLNNSKSYQGLSVQTIANQIAWIGKESIVVFEDITNNATVALGRELERTYQLMCVIQNEVIIAWKGKRKH